ncbi:MAG: hypothetical protein JXB30_06265 [Anaerolineae bacterium]|nr:hypothetical protein [Anaerolineae bacterium]
MHTLAAIIPYKTRWLMLLLLVSIGGVDPFDLRSPPPLYGGGKIERGEI